MSPPYCYDYPRPAVTVDLVILTLQARELRVLLIQRKHDPFARHWAIPGGFLEIDEPIEDATRRELREETGLDYRGTVHPIGVFGDPERDPRGRTISLAHAGVIRSPLPRIGGADDAAEAVWLDPRNVTRLAFDHAAILEAALQWLASAVDEGAAGLAILPREFGDHEVRGLFQALGRPGRAATAWRSRRLKEGRIVPVAGSEGRYRTNPN